ncbi:TPA: hypothetical protein VDT11_006332, partial [Pseudomonas aeruginosa]|nr:hypothetical protein [Pseudomonas aeruginosa]
KLMPLSGVKNRLRERFVEVNFFLNHITSLEPNDPRTATSLEVKVMRGLFHVHLYGAFEKTVNDLVQSMLILLSSKSIKNRHYSPPLLSLVLCDQVKSLKDTSYSNLINRSADLFVISSTEQVMAVSETAMSGSLQNIWMRVIDEIIKAFGLQNLNFNPREIATVNEIVDKRNAVAHGRENASTVGERHNSAVLRQKMEIVISVANSLISAFEQWYENKSFLLESARSEYS